MGKKAVEYVLRFVDGGYYSKYLSFTGAPLERATAMTKKQATVTRARLGALGFVGTVIPKPAEITNAKADD